MVLSYKSASHPQDSEEIDLSSDALQDLNTIVRPRTVVRGCRSHLFEACRRLTNMERRSIHGSLVWSIYCPNRFEVRVIWSFCYALDPLTMSFNPLTMWF